MRSRTEARSAHGEHRRELPDDLRELLNGAVRAAKDLRLAEAENAFRLALLVRAATGRRVEGGGGALKTCADILGLSRSAVQPFSLLAMRWSADELRALFERDQEKCLSVSHLLLICQLPRSERAHWLERVFAERLGVHELRSMVKLGLGGPSDESVTGRRRTCGRSTGERNAQ